MVRVAIVVLAAVLALAAGRAVQAQANVQNAPRKSPIDYAAARDEAQSSTARDAAYADDNTRKLDAAAADYGVWSYEHRRSTFSWQYISSIITFISVLVLMLAGLGFSYMQFKAAAQSGTSTSIKLGRDGLEISSPVIGLLVLFLSLGFFYLYLTNVYPISEIGDGGSTPAVAAVTK